MSTIPTPVPIADHPPQMSRLERFAFASGDIFGGGGTALLSVLYFFFLTDVIHLAPGLAGLVVGTAKVWDALIKPVIGQLSDNTRTRWGRRRPFLMAGAVGIVVAELLLWLPVNPATDQTTKMIVALAGLLLYTTVAATFAVPYASLSTETTNNVAERTRLNLLRVVCAALSSTGVFVGATMVMRAYQAGHLGTQGLYWAIGVAAAIGFAIPVSAVALLTRERTPMPAERSHFSLTRLLSGLAVPEFRSLLGLYLCAGLMIDTVAALVLAYATYVVPVSPPIFMAILIVLNLIGMAIVRTRMPDVSKNRIYGTLLPLGVIGMAGVALWPQTWPVWPAYLAVAVLGVGAAGSQMMSWVMFPDVVDACELHQGERRSGSLTALLAFIRSLCSAALVMLIGGALQVAGYGQGEVGSQPASAIVAIRFLLLVICGGLMVVGWWLARRYPLTHDVVQHNAATLRQRRGAPIE